MAKLLRCTRKMSGPFAYVEVLLSAPCDEVLYPAQITEEQRKCDSDLSEDGTPIVAETKCIECPCGADVEIWEWACCDNFTCRFHGEQTEWYEQGVWSWVCNRCKFRVARGNKENETSCMSDAMVWRF